MKAVTRLFQQFQPSEYQLSLEPSRDTMSFNGTITIRGKKVGRPSQRLTFHQKGLRITAATIVRRDKKGETAVAVSRINTQATYDEVRLHSEQMLYPGDYEVNLVFKGQISTPMHGIYPCTFRHGDTEKQLIATQFESHHAREAFPCIDEPEAKAVFKLELVTPIGETVIANTPIRAQEEQDGKLWTAFTDTPRMSTYLLAFVYGELDYLEATTKDGVLVRTYATPDNVSSTKHSLEVAVKSLEFFGEYFGTKYPLPKLDMVALPDFSSGAMENWGLVTYREVAMLLDEDHGTIESRQYIATVVAHELSHQWFGNLVTMRWWDDLWLNESFANMMEYCAVDAIYPEWHIWEQFVAAEAGSAKRRDSLADVQAIHVTVRHPDEISSLFDPSIVYAKGGTVLYMLMQFIGEDAFRAGLKQYFAKHSYGNTAAADLWTALSATSQQDVAGFMASYINRPGYPLVTIDWQPGSSQAHLSQQRFFSNPAEFSAADAPWQVPLAATVTLSEPLLASAAGTMTVEASDNPLLLNHDGHSYFLPRYAQKAHLLQITQAIKAGQVSPIDRLLLLDNYTMLQRGGQASTTDLLELLPAYQAETSESVWGAIAVAVAEVRRLIEGNDAAEAALNSLMTHLTKDLADEYGWDDRPSDDADTLKMRGLIISLAAGAKVASVLSEGAKRFASFKKPADLSPSTRSVVYFIGARHGSTSDFNKLLNLHHSSQNAEMRDEFAGALTATKDPANFRQLLALLTGSEIRRQDLMHWYVWLLRNRFARVDAWQWLKQNWDWIEVEYASDKSYSYYARYAGSIFSRQSELQDYQAFFGSKKDIIALTRDICLGEQEIASRIAWRGRNEATTLAWLAKQPSK